MKDFNKYFIVGTNSDALHDTMNGLVVGELTRCKDCEDCTETELYDGQRWNYCMRLRCVVKENDFCCWAERKYPKIKAKVTE
jgi:hypothetical protein